ncbi:hypothetical protein IWQ62_001699 [Dispira parvispora]|uniref:Lytic polysaccharide monooxygenase n=1 Tax=Dispira parvispora TaxID=1520584 RepID=A0A9W8E3J2_9FUNG|nr:hypothetical protein IWQ62_001699 [Dispira parvispora]
MKVSVAILLGALATICLGHMYPSKPCVRKSPEPTCNIRKPDYDIMSPIGRDNKPIYPLCHHTTPLLSSAGTFQAGGIIEVEFKNTNTTHNGGHCEFSLSYDGGKSFVAIQTILRSCFYTNETKTVMNRSFNVSIPDGAPSGKVVFAWSWVNASGNREFYMTCSDIEIEGSEDGVLEGPLMITPNYDGSYPLIPDFGGGGEDGSNYYKDRPIVKVTTDSTSTSTCDTPVYPDTPTSGNSERGDKVPSDTGYFTVKPSTTIAPEGNSTSVSPPCSNTKSPSDDISAIQPKSTSTASAEDLPADSQPSVPTSIDGIGTTTTA